MSKDSQLPGPWVPDISTADVGFASCVMSAPPASVSKKEQNARVRAPSAHPQVEEDPESRMKSQTTERQTCSPWQQAMVEPCWDQS